MKTEMGGVTVRSWTNCPYKNKPIHSNYRLINKEINETETLTTPTGMPPQVGKTTQATTLKLTTPSAARVLQ